MNGIFYQDPLAKEKESYDEWDDEAVGTTGEFLGGILGGVSSSIGGLLGGGPKRQPVRPDPRTTFPAPGVRDARLETPRGTANLRLPEEVVSKRAFDEATQNLQDGVGKVTLRVNSLEQKDLPELKKELGTVLANTRQAIADEKKARQKAIIRQAKAMQSTQSTNLIMSLLFQQQLQRKLESHTHPGNDQVPTGSTAEPAPLSGGDNNALLFMMMAGGGMGGGGSSYREDGNGDSYRGESSSNDMMQWLPMMFLFNK
jgi:hypothetical protein